MGSPGALDESSRIPDRILASAQLPEPATSSTVLSGFDGIGFDAITISVGFRNKNNIAVAMSSIRTIVATSTGEPLSWFLIVTLPSL